MKPVFTWAYGFEPVRRALRSAGPGYWRAPRIVRSRALATERLRRRAVWEGSAETFAPSPLSPWPKVAHRSTGRSHRIPAPFAAVLSNTMLIDRFAIPVLEDGRVLLTPFRDQIATLSADRHPELEGLLRAGAPAGSVERVEPPVVSLVGRLSSNYYHWIVDFLPLVRTAEVLRDTLGEEPLLLIPGDGPAFQRVSLHRLGWSHRVLAWGWPRPPLLARRFVACPTPGVQIAPSPGALAWVRDRLLSPSDGRDEQPSAGIYISRPKGSWRTVRNAGLVEEQMRALGLEVLDPGSLSFDEQLQRFARARLIVGQHGAGLTNLLFAPHAAVIEMCGGYGGAEYYGMASAVGARYSAILCQEVDGDLEVDVDRLADLVRSELRNIR